MMSGNNMTVTIFAIIALGIVGLAAVVSSHYRAHNATIAEMVAGGADPLAAVCAMSDTLGDNPTCVILAAGRK